MLRGVTVTSVRAGRIRGDRVAMALAAWGLAYACYRGYYAVGGEVGMIGRPVSPAQFRAVNAAGAAVILLASAFPPAAAHGSVLRRAVPVVGWVGAVGCCMHAAVDAVLRALSLAGVHPTQLPASVWETVDRRTADLQDLLFNEPWFLVEGLLWGVLGLGAVGLARRRAWLVSAALAWVLLTVVGVLSGLGTIPSFSWG